MDHHGHERDLRQRLQDRTIAHLKTEGKVQVIAPSEVMVWLRFITPEYPTTWEATFREIFLKTFPQAKADVEKYQEKPGCGCKRKLHSLIALRYIQVTALLAEAFNARVFEVTNIRSDSSVLATDNSPEVVPNLVGGSLTIPQVPETYGRELRKLLRLGVRQYHGLTVVPDVTDGTPTWTLLYY